MSKEIIVGGLYFEQPIRADSLFYPIGSIDDIEYESCVANPDTDINRHKVVSYRKNTNGIKYDDFDYYDTDTNDWVGVNKLKITKVIFKDIVPNNPTTITTSGTVVTLHNGDKVAVTFGCETFDVK